MKKFSQFAGMAGIVLLVLGTMVGLVQQRASTLVIGHLAGGGVLIILGIVMNLPEIREVLAKRSVRMGPQIVVQTLLVLVILLLLNVLAFRNDVIKDVTERNIFTFQMLTDDVARNLPGEVTVIAFYPGGGPAEARQRLELYNKEYPLVNVRFVDPNKNEDLARAEEVPPQPGILFKYKDQRVWITNYEEMDITNALIKVTRETQPEVWFTTGHGEPSLDSDGPNGLSYLDKMIEQQGYVTESIDLSRLERIPEEVSMVAIVGPAMRFSDHEIGLLDYYLSQGGNAVIFLDPVFEEGSITGLESFLDPYGVSPRWNLVFDPENHLADDKLGLWMVVTDYFEHPIVQGLTEKRTVFYMARSFEEKQYIPSGVHITRLAWSSAQSYERVIDPKTMSMFQTKEERTQYLSTIMSGDESAADGKGPFTLAMAVTKEFKVPRWKREQGLEKNRELRMVLIGGSMICRNMGLYIPYNYDLVMNSFNWLAGEKDLKYIRSTTKRGTRMNVDEKQRDRILYISVMILPEAFMLIGLAVWWRRR